MAPRQGPIATEASLSSSIVAQPGAAGPAGASDDLMAAIDFSRSRLLKRPRETTPTSPASGSGSGSGDLSPSKIARLVAYSPTPLAGAAALEEERRPREDEQVQQQRAGSSENAGQRALADLMSGGAAAAISRLQDAPLLQSAADAASKALDPVHFPGAHGASDKTQDTDHQRVGGRSRDGTSDAANSPSPMDVDPRMYAPQPEAQMDDRTATSLSYAGVRSGGAVSASPSRGMSLPMSSSQMQELAPRSPSKKHKCPYCETEFTRHHNLKSHLLTHSQEKPYACQTCNMRFRRLHDLKRHGKLHTGEKPHVCPKCDRKFARGDALARHSKGAGGCAGRRASGGNFGGDDEYDGVNQSEADESAMTGVVYENSEPDMTEEDRRRLTMPVSQSQQAASQGLQEVHNSTYAPTDTRSGSVLYPAQVSRGSAGTDLPNGIPMVANPSMYGQNAMTETPKPLDPAGAQAIKSHPAFQVSQEQNPTSGPSAPPPGTCASAQGWPSHSPNPQILQCPPQPPRFPRFPGPYRLTDMKAAGTRWPI